MLAPISQGRRDKRSSFRTLKEYLTRELDPVSGERVLRGEVALSDNLLSLETAHAEMRAVAVENKRVSDPIYHYQLTWHPAERPFRDEWEPAAKKTLADLGFENHQYLIVAHDDKKHFHVHVMLNRVHPENYRAHTPKFDKRTLDKALREIEHEQGWQEDPGLYRWDQFAQQAVRNTPEEMERHRQQNAAEKARGKAAEVEHYQDVESLQVYARKKPAGELQKLLAREVVNWQQVHTVLARHGLQLERGERGGYTVRALGTETRVKASDVFRSMFAGKENRAATERKLGAWQEPMLDASREIEKGANTYTLRPKRDLEKRAAQREEREMQRKALRAEFRDYRAQMRGTLREHTETVRHRRQDIKTLLQDIKREIRSKPIPWPAKRALLSHAVAVGIAEDRELKIQAMKERLQLKPKTYEHWVTERAEQGDKRAAAQLRGWRYQDRRNVRRMAEMQDADKTVYFSSAGSRDESSWSEFSIEEVKEQLRRDEELARAISAARWRIDRRTGDVTYIVGGRTALVDRGRTLSVVDTTEVAVLLGLAMAVAKYGPVLSAVGSEEWREQFARVAARNDIKVQFADARTQQCMEDERRRITAPNPHRVLAERLDGFRHKLATDNVLELPDRLAAEQFISALFEAPVGKSIVYELLADTEPGTRRIQELRGVATFVMQRSADGTQARYQVSPHAGKVQEVSDLLRRAAQRAQEHSQMHREKPSRGEEWGRGEDHDFGR